MQPIPYVLRFTVPGRINPVESVLGRLVARFSVDNRQAASRLVILVAAVALLLVIGQYAAFAALHEVVAGAPDSLEAQLIWMVPLALWVLLVVCAGVGYTAPTTIEVGDRISIQGPGGTLTLSHTSVKPRRISRSRYYDHYRRYTETTSFVGRLVEPEILLLVFRDRGPVALELTTEEIDAFLVAHRLRTLHTIRGIHAPLSELPALAS